jgi:catechol 2,3-dioxygenase-like lactoylglutathione lyase family enzyme
VPRMFLDYAGIRVTNLAKAKKFLEKGLGLSEVRRGTMPHGGVWVLFQDRSSGQRLELNYYPPGNPYATPFVPGEGLDHIGVRVQDVARAGRQVKAAGGRLVEQYKEGRTPVVAYYEGPDGIWVELIRSPSV